MNIFEKIKCLFFNKKDTKIDKNIYAVFKCKQIKDILKLKELHDAYKKHDFLGIFCRSCFVLKIDYTPQTKTTLDYFFNEQIITIKNSLDVPIEAIFAVNKNIPKFIKNKHVVEEFEVPLRYFAFNNALKCMLTIDDSLAYKLYIKYKDDPDLEKILVKSYDKIYTFKEYIENIRRTYEYNDM